MNSPKKRPTTYRLTPELDGIIASEAKRLGVSKNALVQMKLADVFGKIAHDDQMRETKPTGTEGR